MCQYAIARSSSLGYVPASFFPFTNKKEAIKAAKTAGCDAIWRDATASGGTVTLIPTK